MTSPSGRGSLGCSVPGSHQVWVCCGLELGAAGVPQGVQPLLPARSTQRHRDGCGVLRPFRCAARGATWHKSHQRQMGQRRAFRMEQGFGNQAELWKGASSVSLDAWVPSSLGRAQPAPSTSHTLGHPTDCVWGGSGMTWLQGSPALCLGCAWSPMGTAELGMLLIHKGLSV